MKTYRIKLNISSGVLTAFQADTIFGHLCWVVAYLGGDDELQEFLKPFKEGFPPFIISDGFPCDLVPKPLSVEFNITDAVERKELKKLDFITLEDFNRARKGEIFKIQRPESLVTITTATHNIVSRLTHTALTEGGVYSLEENIISSVCVYLKVKSDVWKNRVVQLFTELSKSGYGRKKSIGKGQFSVGDVSECTFENLKNETGFVTLSNFCPEKDDPTEGLYKTFVKYGKLGEEFTFCGNPFKRPLLMIKTGSVFKTDGSPKEFYGRIVQDGIAPAKPEVVQYAYAFAVPIKYPKL